MRPSFALVPQTHTLTAVEASRQWWPPFATGGLLAFLLFLVGMPIASVALMAVSSAGTLALLTTATRRSVSVIPESIASIEARRIYRGILAACEEIETAIEEAPASPTLLGLRDRCRAAAEISARIAFVANPLQRYLDAHDPNILRRDLDRLRARTESTIDERALASLSRATAARARQLETYDEMYAIRDRIHARLELVQTSLEAFAAQVVKLHVIEEEQLVLAGDTIADRVDDIGEDLDILESALAMHA